MKKVIKRNGNIVSYDKRKIEEAVKKAFIETKELPEGDIEEVSKVFAAIVDTTITKSEKEIVTIEEIQDEVERSLMSVAPMTAKAYILYRSEHERIREANNRLMSTFESILTSSSKENDLKRENANIDGDTPMGAMLKFGSESSKHFTMLKVLNPKHAEAHESGDIHVHDLDFYNWTLTCCQIDLEKLFSEGFNTGHGFIREPQSIQSYGALAAIAIQANQNDMHGGQGIANFDKDMAIGVRKTYKRLFYQKLADVLEDVLEEDVSEDVSKVKGRMELRGCCPKMDDSERFDMKISGILAHQIIESKFTTETQKSPNRVFDEVFEIVEKAIKTAHKRALRDTDKATHQTMESFVHNLNTLHSRAGSQVPFSSINFGTDTTPEARMVSKNLLLATMEGLGNGETPIFPISIFRLKKGINMDKGDINYDLFKLALKCSAKRMFPNFSFQDAPFNLQYYKKGRPETEISYMGCRTRVIGNVNDKEREVTTGRGNLSFTSINIPRIAIKNMGNIDGFMKDLDSHLELSLNQLLERFEVQCRKKVYNMPFLMGQGVWMDSENLKWDDEIREIIKHGTLSIGFIGLAEALTALIGCHHGESEKARNLGVSIVKRMRDFCDEKSETLGLNITLIGTPAEGLSGRFLRLDRKKYGVIEGITDKDYYTNSFHVPVAYEISIKDKIDAEAPYHALCNAGHISYIELDGDPSQNIEAMETIVKYMAKAGIGYGAINHPIDRDPICGYSGVIGDTCPKCGRTEEGVPFERIRRITGYLVGTVDRFNDAKKAEEKDRTKHSRI